MDLPELSETAESVSQQAKTLIPWLPDPMECPECAVYCNYDHGYDPARAAFFPVGQCPIWRCPNCETKYRREE